MHAMILAAGRGERMRPLTDSTPKPLLRVGGHHLIEYPLRALADAGIKDVVINYAHLGAQITQALGDGSKYGLNIVYSAEPAGALETGGGIVEALPLLKTNPFVVVNSDVWSDYDFADLPNDITNLAHIVLVPNPPHNPEGDFILSGRHVYGLEQTQQKGKRLTFSGIGLYRHALFQNLARGRFPLAPILTEAIRQQTVTGEIHTGVWQDVGTRERLVELNERLEAGQSGCQL